MGAQRKNHSSRKVAAFEEGNRLMQCPNCGSRRIRKDGLSKTDQLCTSGSTLHCFLASK